MVTTVAAVKTFVKKGAAAQNAVNEILLKDSPKDQVIQWTTNYDRFKLLAGNRPIVHTHVMQLINSMREQDVPVAVIVNERFEVIDGQHRVEAHRELKTRVPYIVVPGLTIMDVARLNSTSKSWVPEDYARSYVEQGIEDYIVYSEFRKTWGLHHDISVILLSGRGATASRNDFRTGQFVIHDLDGARKMASILHTAIKPIWPVGWRDSSFLRALHIATTRIGFDMDRFLKAANENRHLFVVYRSIDSYLLMIEDMYNAVPGKRVPIRYGKSETGAAVHKNAGRGKYKDNPGMAKEKRALNAKRSAAKTKGTVRKVGGAKFAAQKSKKRPIKVIKKGAKK